MKRRLLCVLLVLVLAVSLIPGTAVAVNNTTANPTPETITDNGLVNAKKIEKNTQTGNYDLTLETYATGSEITEMTPMDIVMVIDQSAAMGTQDMNPTYTPASTPSGGWTINDATGHETYFYKVGNNYYPVQAEEGMLYEAVSNPVYIYQMIGSGHDGLTVGVNGSPSHFNVPTKYYTLDSAGKPHKVYVITIGEFAQYAAYTYYYTNNTGAKEIVTDYDDGFFGAGSSFTKSNVEVNESKPYNNGNEWTENIYWASVSLSNLSELDGLWNSTNLYKSRFGNVRDHYNNNSEYVVSATLFNGSYKWRSLAYNQQVCFVGQNNAGITSANGNMMHYSWISNGDNANKNHDLYLPKDGVNYNKLFYVDGNGNKQYIGNQVYTEDQTAYSGTLYKVQGESRLSVLQNAASQFVQAVADNAEENNVDHRIAMVGFAGNKYPAVSSGTTAYDTTEYDFTNTGVFVHGDFKNYQTIKSLSTAGTKYINMHYYTSSGVSNGIPTGDPLTYKNGNWYRLGSNSVYNGSFYEPNYESLNSSDYQDALVDASKKTGDSYNGIVADDLTSAIENFAHYGGSYTSYGMTMANNVFENNTKTYVDKFGETKDRARIIVVFTCGEPGGNGYSSSIAGEALVDGNRAKYESNDNGYNADVYTIGLFPGNATSETENFMRNLSSQYTVPVSNVYGGTNNGVSSNGSGQLDGDHTYYFTDTDGKTLAVTTQKDGLSTLGWWTKTEDGYYRQYPKTKSNDSRTVDGVSVITFYNSNGNAVYESDLQQGTVYFTSSTTRNASTAIKYEYRWYDSNNKVRDPIKNSYGTYDTTRNTWQFFALGSPVANTDGGTYYYDVKNEATTLAAFNEAFEQIKNHNTISSTTLDATTSLVRDVISDDFDLVENPQVEIKTVDVEDYNSAGKPNWSSEKKQASGVNYSINGKTFDITGFDFSSNYVDKSKADNVEGERGKKLEITISGLKPNKVGKVVESNTASSAVYSNENNTEQLVTEFPVPSVDTTQESFHVQVGTVGKNGSITLGDMNDYTFAPTYFDESNGTVKAFDKFSLLKKKNGKYEYLYGGLYEDAAFSKPITSEPGQKFTPKIGKTYYLKQVDPSYLTVKTIYITYGSELKGSYSVTAVDSKHYDKVGLIYSGDRENYETDTTYDTINVITYKNGQRQTGTADAKTMFKVNGTTDSMAVDASGKTYNGTVQAYWITPDNVKVTGSVIRTMKDGRKDPDVTEEPDNANINITPLNGTVTGLLKNQTMFVADEEEEITPSDNSVNLLGYTLSLKGDIAMNFYMELGDKAASDQDAYMQFTLPGGNHTAEQVKISEARTGEVDGKPCYIFSAGVAAKDMTGQIKAQFVQGDGTKSKEYTTTIRDYCEYIINHAKSEGGQYEDEAVALAKAIENYGGYTQLSFNHKTDALANAGKEYPLPDVDLEAITNPERTGNCSGATYLGTSAMLTTTTGLKHYFKLEGDADNYSFTVNGEELQAVQKSGKVSVLIDDVWARDLGEPITLTVTNKEDGTMITLRYSVYNYIKQVLTQGSFEQTTKDMVKALYGYGEAVKAYLATKN